MKKLSLIIRKITVPSVFAAALLTILYLTCPEYFGNFWQFTCGLVFLVILPVLACPLQKYIPHYREKGREGQRSLAMLFSGIGYLLGTAAAFAADAPDALKTIYLEYLLCGLILTAFNKLFGLKASGHACGVVGPVLLFAYFKLYIPAVLGLILTVPVYISSVKAKRHTVPQLIGGSVIPFAAFCIVYLIMR